MLQELEIKDCAGCIYIYLYILTCVCDNKDYQFGGDMEVLDEGKGKVI